MKNRKKLYVELRRKKRYHEPYKTYFDLMDQSTSRQRFDETQLSLFPSDDVEQPLVLDILWNRDGEINLASAEKFAKKALLLVDRINAEMDTKPTLVRPPFNAEYVLYLLLKKEERDVVIGDLLESYGQLVLRFNRRRADIWFYKQVGGSLFPFLRRALVRIGALVWLGRILRRLVS